MFSGKLHEIRLWGFYYYSRAKFNGNGIDCRPTGQERLLHLFNLHISSPIGYKRQIKSKSLPSVCVCLFVLTCDIGTEDTVLSLVGTSMQRGAGGRKHSPPPSKTRVSVRATRKDSPSSPSISSHYDTKDPFSALSLLRKLLNNTASSGYKISPDEHKLSLHLLTVIEPFVSTAPMDQEEARRTMTRQPNEILDMMVFHVDSRKDLLALALTCKRLCDIVLPRHLEYRVIHCKPSSIKVWRHLIAHPLLACNVRHLQVMDDRSRDAEIVPSRAAEKLDIPPTGLELHKEQQRLILGALTNMTTLTSFYWACNNSLISFEDVCPTLFTCEMLMEVEISDNQMFSSAPKTIGYSENSEEDQLSSPVRNYSSLQLYPS